MKFRESLIIAATSFLLSLDCRNLIQDYQMEPEVIMVHIVPHSHMDAGWLKTYQEYFDSEVKKILTTVTFKLLRHSEYKYTVGDLSFFRDWYG